jgi:hypothetical protein
MMHVGWHLSILPLGTRHMSDAHEPQRQLTPGTRVEIRRRFDAKWAQGFEVLHATGEGYRVRRLSDGTELPVVIDAADVRKAAKRDFWWY